jgi:hypothetical protein
MKSEIFSSAQKINVKNRLSRFLHDPDIYLHSNFKQATFLLPPQAPTLPA